MRRRRRLERDGRRRRLRSAAGLSPSENLGIVKLGPELIRLRVFWVFTAVVVFVATQGRTRDEAAAIAAPPPLVLVQFLAEAAATVTVTVAGTGGEVVRSRALCHRTDHCALPLATESVATATAEAAPAPP